MITSPLVAVGVFFLGVMLWALGETEWPIMRGDALSRGMPFALPIAGAMTAVLALRADRPQTRDVMAFGFLWTVGLTMLGAGLIGVVNGMFDRSSPREFRAVTRARGRTAVYFDPSENSPVGTRAISCPHVRCTAFFDGGESALVTFRSGRLGLGWCVEVRRANP